MESFHASGSVANTGTGARREGEDFERLVGDMWCAFGDLIATAGANSCVVAGVGARRHKKLEVAPRVLYIPTSCNSRPTCRDSYGLQWLDVSYKVSDLICTYPTQAQAIREYAPKLGPYSGDKYPEIYNGLETKFDDTVVLVDDGVLREKILLEYKTAKSSNGQTIDGNAHERLSFQIMQYLEVATRYTKCSFVVLANGAFVYYRNKYHVNFHVQADRLRNFAWFEMEYACTVPEYTRFLDGLLSWLFEGSARL